MGTPTGHFLSRSLGIFVALMCIGAAHGAFQKQADTVGPFYSPASSDDFKATPLIELTRSNAEHILGAQKCTLVFTTPMFPKETESAGYTLALARMIAREFRSNNHVLIAHAAVDIDGKTFSSPLHDDEPFKKFLQVVETDIPLTLVRTSTKDSLYRFFRGKNMNAMGLRELISKKCHEEGIMNENMYDHETLSVIFKTNKTLALLANGFDVSDDIKDWLEDYCADFPIPTDYNDVTVLEAADVTVKKFLCLHAFAGRPLIMKNAVNDWPALKKWKPTGTWIDSMASTELSADIGVEPGWSGTRLSSHEYFEYMLQNAAERKALREQNVTMPPWSSIYAYTHQHSRTDKGFVADIMWPDFEAPSIFNRQNWFRYMGDCHKMMTVIFWATEGARQSNHQDDFGSSKWQAQVYGRKKWIMHPPEESEKLYNGKVDPFEPDYDRYPLYKDVRRVEFVLEEGDVLFWSAGWWHATLALENSLAVAQNILNEHNYLEFRRTSRAACEPGGSHGVYSPWCACFRRTYGKWDELYKGWVNDIEKKTPAKNYDFTRFKSHADVAQKDGHADLTRGIQTVLTTLQGDVAHFMEHEEFPVDTAHSDL